MTKPIASNNGQTKQFPAGERVIYDGNVPDDAWLHFALVAFDQDSEKDWTRYGEVVTKLADSISSYVEDKSKNRSVQLAAKLVPKAIAAISWLGSLDKDDKLGEMAFDIPVKEIRPPEERKWRLNETGLGWSTWDYTLTYRFQIR